MPRGVVPRQPARTGRQDRVAAAPPATKKVLKQAGGRSEARPTQRALSPEVRRPETSKASKRGGSSARYNPLAQERVTEILKRLDQLYPEVTCALTHKSAWELLVATILSAQSTDVN